MESQREYILGLIPPVEDPDKHRDHITSRKITDPIRQIGQKFPLFDAIQSKEGMNWSSIDLNDKISEFFSEFTLDLENDNLPNLMFTAEAIAHGSNAEPLSSATPFDPEIGYIIDKYDENLGDRAEKVWFFEQKTGYGIPKLNIPRENNDNLEPSKSQGDRKILDQKSPLTLIVSPNFEHVLNWESIEEFKAALESITPQIDDFLKRLRLFVLFPEINGWEDYIFDYQAQIDRMLGRTKQRFVGFYPSSRKGPFPHVDYPYQVCSSLNNGCVSLRLPTDELKLKSIKAEFRLT